jgi:isopropylmalate/homocitrate/citramalate synthase
MSKKRILPREYKPRVIEIIDTTLREGAQSPLLDDTNKFFFSLTEKLRIIEALIQHGIRFIEVFSPIVSVQEGEDLRAIITRRDELTQLYNSPCFILAHVRLPAKLLLLLLIH